MEESPKPEKPNRESVLINETQMRQMINDSTWQGEGVITATSNFCVELENLLETVTDYDQLKNELLGIVTERQQFVKAADKWFP